MITLILAIVLAYILIGITISYFIIKKHIIDEQEYLITVFGWAIILPLNYCYTHIKSFRLWLDRKRGW